MTPSEMTLLILAGGESTRMGTPKHLLPVPEGTMLDRIIARIGGMFSEVVVVGRSIQPPAEGILVADDIRSERCPLVGILSGLLVSKSAFSFVLACDMPFVEPPIIELIASKAGAGGEVVVPVIRGLFEPLCAVYGRSVTGRITECLDAGRTKTTCFYPLVSVAKVPEAEIRLIDPELASFVNLNTPSDYRRHCATS